MPVLVYSGPPGSGKSYLAAKDILKELNDGREVWTNFEFRPWVYQAYPNLKRIGDDEMPYVWSKLPDNALLVCEEALMFYPADYAKGDNILRKQFREWIVYHRHHGQDFWLIVQSWSMLSDLVRAVVDVRLQVHNKGHLGFKRGYAVAEYSPGNARHPFRERGGMYDKKCLIAIKVSSQVRSWLRKRVSPF